MALVIECSCNKEILWQHWPSSCWLNGQKFIPRWERTQFLCPLNRWLLSAASLAGLKLWENLRGAHLWDLWGGERDCSSQMEAPGHPRQLICEKCEFSDSTPGSQASRARLRTAELARQFFPCLSQDQVCSSQSESPEQTFPGLCHTGPCFLLPSPAAFSTAGCGLGAPAGDECILLLHPLEPRCPLFLLMMRSIRARGKMRGSLKSQNSCHPGSNSCSSLLRGSDQMKFRYRRLYK